MLSDIDRKFLRLACDEAKDGLTRVAVPSALSWLVALNLPLKAAISASRKAIRDRVKFCALTW